jgi:hypothetical protein
MLKPSGRIRSAHNLFNSVLTSPPRWRSVQFSSDKESSAIIHFLFIRSFFWNVFLFYYPFDVATHKAIKKILSFTPLFFFFRQDTKKKNTKKGHFFLLLFEKSFSFSSSLVSLLGHLPPPPPSLTSRIAGS